MRKRPCPEGVPARRAVGVAVFVALLGLVLAVTASLRAQAEKGLVGDRLDRVRQSQTEQQATQQADSEPWSAAKIIINLDARCPVITALGYFGAFATTDPDSAKSAELQARYAKLQKTAQPLAEEMKKIAVANTFAGRKFPAALVPRLNVMSADLYGEIAKIYGDEALIELKRYVSTQSQGVYMPD